MIFFDRWIVGRSGSVSFLVEALRGIIYFHVLLLHQWSLSEKIVEDNLNPPVTLSLKLPYISVREKLMFGFFFFFGVCNPPIF